MSPLCNFAVEPARRLNSHDPNHAAFPARREASTWASAFCLPADTCGRREKLVSQLGVAGCGTRALGVDNKIKVRRDFGGGPSKDLPEQALHAVSDHSTADLARDREAEAVVPQGVRLGK